MTLTAEARTAPLPRPRDARPDDSVSPITLVGDLTCPWSYLASRRATLLEADGVEVGWAMVEHERRVPRRSPADATVEAERLARTRRDLEHVTRRLLPGERLPTALAGFVPYTRPAVSGYAEAELAGVGRPVRRLLFDAFWMHGVDVGDARLVRTLLVDAVRSSGSPCELVREWGYAVDVTGAPVSTAAWRLLQRWRDEWSRAGHVVPALVVDGGRRMSGVEAVEWLGAEVVRRGLEPDGAALYRTAAPAPPARPDQRDLADRLWASEHGNRWMQERRAALAAPLLERLRPWV